MGCFSPIFFTLPISIGLAVDIFRGNGQAEIIANRPRYFKVFKIRKSRQKPGQDH